MNLIKLTCTHCDKQYCLKQKRYEDKLKKGTKHFYCSNECSIAYRKAKMKPNVICLTCNKNFYRAPKAIAKKSFCSKSCAASYNNKGLQRNPPKPRICIRCNHEFFWLNDERSTICLNCKNGRTRSITLNECMEKLAVKGKHSSWKGSYVRLHNSSFNKDLKKLPCQKCGYANHVELAHIKPVSSFEESALLEEVNSSDNILVLCPNHHWEFDNGLLSLDDIPKRIACSEGLEPTT